MARRAIRMLSALFVTLGAVALAAAPTDAVDDRSVIVLPARGIVDQVLAGYLADGIARAEREGAAAVVIELNTPGGGLESTNDIVGVILDANVPTIVWVAPSGGRAASAGTFITLAGHIALMAPGTSIGAASPVDGQGNDIPGTLGAKVMNDAIAKIRAIAEARNRNVDWAVSTVRDAVSSAASEAVSVGAVDGIAQSLEDVLAFADGREVQIGSDPVVIDLAGATPVERPMNALQEIIRLLGDPNIAFLLFTVGSLGLLYELQNPNFATGILGGLAIILAFIGFGSLPLNVGGIILIAFGILLLALETTVTSHGLLAAGGLVCFVLGASALYTEPGDPFGPLVGVATPLIVVMTATAAAFAGLISFMAVRTRRMTGTGLVGIAVASGAHGVVRRPIEPLGSVHIAGEEWTARSASDRPIERGTPVTVVAVDGLTVLVEPDSQPSQA
ncbi:MAG TPA: nodulation protein NfeD [Candidatus Limnocylindrales bacterium]|nr:nodulation protein NfeD [Candidatus Limnocylindrales bacterium]